VISAAAENSNKFPKNQVLEGKISRGRGNTWANGTGRTSTNEGKNVSNYPRYACYNWELAYVT
jgi:hypothetical protein